MLPSRALLEHAVALQDRYQLSFYDSLMVAAALEAGCRILYSEDFQHGQQLGSLRIVNPFREPPPVPRARRRRA